MKTQRPNVLFILFDQHNAKVLGHKGPPDVKTPHLKENGLANLKDHDTLKEFGDHGCHTVDGRPSKVFCEDGQEGWSVRKATLLRRVIAVSLCMFWTVWCGDACLGTALPDVSLTFTQYASMEAIGNFDTNDLLQGLAPDHAGGLNERGLYVVDLSTGDAKSTVDPGSATPSASRMWPAMPAYLVYTFPSPCDLSEIRITAPVARGADIPGSSDTARGTLGDIALGIEGRMNPGGKQPIRPAENAIEVLFEGSKRWMPIVTGRVFSGRRTMAEGCWQGVWTFSGNGLRSVRRLKIVLGPTSMWGSYGQLTRLAEVDVIGVPSQDVIPEAYTAIPANDPGIAVHGFVGPVPGNGLRLEWSGSGFEARFRSRSCRLRFQAPSGSRYWISVDGSPYEDTAVEPVVDLTARLVPSAQNKHRLRVIKKTERDQGTDVFRGIDLDSDGYLMPMTNSASRKILFLGDSITVGHQSPRRGETDVMSTYAWIIGAHFGADIRVIALSGVGVFKGWRATPFLAEWTRAMEVENRSVKATGRGRWQPDLIIINLGTNDASKGVKGTQFSGAMEVLLHAVAADYPTSRLLVMVPWTYGCYRDVLRSLVGRLSGHMPAGIYFVDADKDSWVTKDGMSDNTHPNFTGHTAAAERLIPMIKEVTQW